MTFEHFLSLAIVMIMFSLGFELIVLWCEAKRGVSRETLNPAIMKCSACAAKCHKSFAGPNPRSWQWWVSYSIWAFLFVPFLIPGGLPMTWVFAIGIPMAWMKREAQDRLYHNWWTWRHPMRCQGGGEPELAPAGSGA